MKASHACLLLVVCAAACTEMDRGYFNEWLPAYCRGSQLDSLHNDVRVIYAPLRDAAPPLLRAQGKRVLGVCLFCGQPVAAYRLIIIEQWLDHNAERGAIRHEKCHIESYLRTGNVKFHD